MKNLLLISLFVVLVAISHGGTISGTVRAKGKEASDADASAGKYDSKKFKFAERMNYDELHDFVVFVEGSLTNLHLTAPTNHLQIVTQKDATFSPHVLPVMAGTVVEWPNRDDIFHNAFSFSDAKQFDFGLYGKDSITNVAFDTSGRVDVFCSIHKDMHCVVLVVQNPFFATTDSRGHYAITNVPPGTYKLKAWHERLPSRSLEITVPESGEVRADFVLGWPGSAKP